MVLDAAQNKSIQQIISAAAAAGSEWALASQGKLQAYIGGEACPAATAGAQWR